MTVKTKKDKAPKFQIEPVSAWSVSKYGVPLIINPSMDTWGLFNDGVSLDVEDDEQGNFVGLGIYDGIHCYYWNDWELAKQLTIPKFIAHNGRTDLAKLQKWGFKVDESFLLWDTQLIEHILDSSKKRYGLKTLVSDMGINYPSYEDLTGKKGTKGHKTLKDLDPMLVAEYNAMDCYATYKLFEKQSQGSKKFVPAMCDMPVDTDYGYFQAIEKPVAFIFQKMEDKGISLDLSYLSDLYAVLEHKLKPLEAAIKNELGDINLNSPKQLLEALHAKEIYPEFKGKASTDKRALENLRGKDIVSNLLQYSQLETLITGFIAPYLERNQEVVHPQFHQTGTRTGRPSCSNPNLLQIPRKTDNGKLVRQMFIAREGCLLGDCDFGQIEPRVLAHLSKDKTMLQMFNDGIDFHTFTAERLFHSTVPACRDKAKVLNLSVGYRASYKSVSQQLKCSWDEAQKEIDAWWSMFPSLWDWQQQLIHTTKQKHYFTTLLGRRIKVEYLDHGNQWRREGAERQLINNITQASAAEIMKMAMIAVSRENVDILCQIYDELLIEECEDGIQDAVQKTVEAMTTCVKLDVPLTVDAGIGRSWTEAKGD